jgi:arabinose-5-phosphate isomerase
MVATSRTGRRSGAVMLIDQDGKLVGLFTDSDLARILEHRDDAALDQDIASRMTRDPRSVASGTLLQEAVAMMSHHRISEIPVIDATNRPIGLLDITDIVSLTQDDNGPVTVPFESI